MKKIIVDFEKIGHNGVSIGRYNNKIVFAYGIFPEEKVEIEITTQKKNFIEGKLIRVINSSPLRVEPKEDHYLSCSPWQSFKYDFQIEIKKKLLKEIYKDFAEEDIIIDEFYEAENIFHYRTKIEYSFLKEDQYYFAFYQRGSSNEKVKIKEGCILISESANYKASKLLDIINEKKLKNLKSLIIRESKNFSNHHISLLTTEKQKFDVSWLKNLTSLSFIFAYSNPKSPASVFTKILESYGNKYLQEKILNLNFKYNYDSFFQNNIELFEKALIKMIENCDEFKKIVDLYCGVGVIGIVLSKFGKEIIGVDSNENSIRYANLNAQENDVKNFKAITSLSERIPLDILNKVELLILDPPRSGLHKKLINLILDTSPYKIFYLSCNPVTQARDYFYLKKNYNIKKIYGFDFYPNTPHLESLIILEKKL